MRITKKYIREAKSDLMKRVIQLNALTDDELVQEAKRFMTDTGVAGDLSRGTLISFLTRDAIECAFPSHWLD